MRVKFIFCCFISVFLFSNVCAKSVAIDKEKVSTKEVISKVYLVDDFDLDTKKASVPDWWFYGDMKYEYGDNALYGLDYLGQRSLRLYGSTKKWLIGVAGTYFGIDGTLYNTLKLVVHGYGKESGILNIELFDDDNNNWEIEVEENDSSRAAFDDKFVYSFKVDWSGWKVLQIPLSEFVDDNPRIGDNKWNPNQNNDSGGLLQMQILLLANKDKGKARVEIDTIKFFKRQIVKMVETGSEGVDKW
jgi:hypothetical protein